MQAADLIKRRRVKRIRIFSIAALSLCLLSFAIWFGYSTLKVTNDTSVQESSYLYGIGETVTLDSQKDEEGYGYDNRPATFGWDGTMEYTIKEAKLYPSFEETGLDASKRRETPDAADTQVLVLQLELYNKDAEPSHDNFFFISNLTNITTSSNAMASEERLVYFDDTADDADPEKGFGMFRLEKGERKAFTVALEVPTEAIHENTSVAIGLSNLNKYRINLGLGNEDVS